MRPFKWQGLLHLVRVGLLVPAVCAILLAGPVGLAQTPPPAQDGAAFSIAYDHTLKLRADRTGELLETRRIRIFALAAVRRLAQQTVDFTEGMESFTIVAAFTEKPDGSKIHVDLNTVITRDSATGLEGNYTRDRKLVTIIFSHVSVGDTLVLTAQRAIHSDVFAGHYQQLIPFPRSVPFADSTMRVIAPAALPLKVGVHGEGVEHSTETEGGETRHFITYRPRPTAAAEDRMTSPLDRDPRVSITTFDSYEELARSYWGPAAAAIEVTPEIATLAEEITRGIDDKRGQARAISNWVKANIRYVFVALGVSRVVPNSAPSVLKNRYGDCKDHTVLMTALLAAKGIAVEHVLINGANTYTLPDPATMGYINHVMVYLPELGIYDDPTVHFAPFGVLGDGDYDKPVIHVSHRGAYRAHTPAMVPEDHQSIRRTRLSVAADGTVSGETEQVGTGLLAAFARSIAASLQVNGLDKSAENTLRSIGAPGKGRYEIGSLTEQGDSYTVRSRFVYDAPMNIKPSSSYSIPTGLGILARPGDWLLAARNPARKLPFVCLAGKQIEEVEITFAEGLPLPLKIDDRRVESRSLVYNAEHRLEHRTLKVRREFISRVPRQVCAADIEQEVAKPMRDVFASNAVRMAFPAQPVTAPTAPPEIKRVAVVDQPLRVDFLYALNPDCSSIGVTSVVISEGPKHGKLTAEKTSGFSNFAQDNPRSACNRRRSEGMLISYRSDSGYLGSDSAAVEIIYGDGRSSKRRYDISVKPKPQPREFTRVALADQRVQVGFIHNLEPDCSAIPVASVQIVEEPKHGKATVESGTGFTNFEKTNSRFECNKQRSDGTLVWYRSEPGYAGLDAVTLEISLADGRQYSTRYVITVK